MAWQMQSTDGLCVFSCFCHFVNAAVADLGSASEAFFEGLQQGLWLVSPVTEPEEKLFNLMDA